MHTSKFGLRALAVGATAILACGLEPDEIDFASMGDTGLGNTGDNEGGDAGDGDAGDGDPTGTGTGDGDPGTGDGDPGTGDGDGDPTGDGDGDPGTGDGDGDPTGDGDGDLCEDLPADPLDLGDNPVILPNLMSAYAGSCGGDGPELLLSFTAPEDGNFSFLLSSGEFEGLLYLVGPSCVPLDEISCDVEGVALEHLMLANEIVHVLVDSTLDPGAGVVTIAKL